MPKLRLVPYALLTVGGLLDQLLGVGQAGAAGAAQHAGHLGHAGFALHRADLALGLALAGGLGHDEMMVGAGGHLGQVGHRQHLHALAQLFHQPAHRIRHGAAHAGIDLVEDQRARVEGGGRTAAALLRGGDWVATAPSLMGRGALQAWRRCQCL